MFLLRKYSRDDLKRTFIKDKKQFIMRALINLTVGAIVSIPVLIVPIRSAVPISIFFRSFFPTFACGLIIVLFHNTICRFLKVMI